MLSLNFTHDQPRYLTMVPLFDLINHRIPIKLDKLDAMNFSLLPLNRRDVDSGHVESFLTFKAFGDFGSGEEFSYAFRNDLQPLQMMFQYGIVSEEDNPFAEVSITIDNFYKTKFTKE